MAHGVAVDLAVAHHFHILQTLEGRASGRQEVGGGEELHSVVFLCVGGGAIGRGYQFVACRGLAGFRGLGFRLGRFLLNGFRLGGFLFGRRGLVFGNLHTRRKFACGHRTLVGRRHSGLALYLTLCGGGLVGHRRGGLGLGVICLGRGGLLR